MTSISIGDLARHLVLQQGAGRAKTELNRLAQELASGRKVDPAQGVRGNFSPLAAIDSHLAQIKGWQSASSALGLRLRGMQSALGALDAIGQSQSEALLRAAGTNQPGLVDLAAGDALEHLDTALGLLNTTAGGQSVFAGTSSDRPALGGLETLLDTVLPLAGAAATPQAAMAAIRDWFDDPAGFATTLYQGGAEQPRIAVGQGSTLAAGFTANAEPLRELLIGLTGAALLDRGLFSNDPLARQKMIGAAGEVLAGNAEPRATLAAGLGLVEYRLAQTETRNSSEAAVLDQTRNAILAADPFDTATNLEQAETQLSLIHVLTARLQGLSLLEALR